VFDLLEKGMREPDENDWMLAYSIEGHPELHLSHHYFRGLTEEQAQDVVNKLKEHFAKKPLQAKPIQLNQTEHFGPEKDIRVLVNDQLAPHLDPEIKQQMEALHPSRFPTYRPHVTTNHHQNINSKISGYYFQRGNGQTYFATNASPSISESSQNMSDSTNEPMTKATGTPKVNAKIEGIEVKRPMTGVAGQKTSVSSPAMPMPKVGVPPKASAMTGKVNNMPQAPAAPKPPQPLNKTDDSAAWLAAQNKGKATAPKPPAEPPTLDYSTFKRPTYSQSGAKPPLHNPIQHSQGALTGMHKAEGNTTKDKFERCVMHVKAKNKAEGQTTEEKNPWAFCNASLDKTENECNTPEYIVKNDCSSMEKLQKLRKCMALKKAMPVFQRD